MSVVGGEDDDALVVLARCYQVRRMGMPLRGTSFD